MSEEGRFPQSGEHFAKRYEVVRALGDGDRKRTFLARDLRLNRDVALAIIKPDALIRDPDGTEREARVLGELGSHDNIVSVYESDETTGFEYLVFEYLPGGTLADLMRIDGPLALDDLLRFGRQLSRALTHVHSRGVIHRDVSPMNIWLDERKTSHLGDFDSAMLLGDESAGRPVTTNVFASPEEWRRGKLDARSDLYSLGGVLYALATGTARPARFDNLAERRAELPLSLVSLICALTSELPTERPPSAGEVLRRLDAIRRAPLATTLIARDEGESLEFKSSLCHPHGPLPGALAKRVERGELSSDAAEKLVMRELERSVLKTIAAFLNSDGGQLLIGVGPGKEVVGVEADFPHLDKRCQDIDGWYQRLRQLVADLLDAAAWDSMHCYPEKIEDRTIAIVSCSRRGVETWYREKLDGGGVAHQLFVRNGSSSVALDGPALAAHLRTHWAKG